VKGTGSLEAAAFGGNDELFAVETGPPSRKKRAWKKNSGGGNLNHLWCGLVFFVGVLGSFFGVGSVVIGGAAGF